MAFVDQGLWGILAKCCASGRTAAAVSSEGLTGTVGRASRMVLSDVRQVSSLASPRASDPRESKADVTMSFVT